MRQRGGTQFKHLYGTARWKRLRRAQLEREPLCSMCAKRGRVTEATVCNHTLGHPDGETEDQFWSGPFDSQCNDCHNGDTARIERGATQLKGCDDDGWPIDAGPAWNRRSEGVERPNVPRSVGRR